MRRYTLRVADRQYVIDVKEIAANSFRVMVANQSYEVELVSEEDLPEAVIRPEIVPARAAPNASAHRPPPAETLRPLPQTPQPALPNPPAQAAQPSPSSVLAPMPGTILSVDVSAGQAVSRGQQLLVLEAMKMKNPIKSPAAAVVAEVSVAQGQTVSYGDVLIRFREDHT